MAASIIHVVPFHDVDSMKIVWHGHYYKYFELARTALYRSRALDVEQVKHLGYRIPVIESKCRYIRPLVYGQTIKVTARFKSWEHYLLIIYTIQSVSEGEYFASGYTKQAVCDQNSNLLMRVPEIIIAAITQ